MIRWAMFGAVVAFLALAWLMAPAWWPITVNFRAD